ncbi:MAG: asparagine synthase-related protein [Thiobacillus sp.]
MTLFTGTLDADAQRASLFLQGSRTLAPDLPWLKHTAPRLGRLALALDSAPQTPYSTFEETSGQRVFVLGDILNMAESNNAAWLHAQCRDNGPEMLARQNGYYLAGMVDEHETVYLAADQLGLMPLYYWEKADHFCFSTSPNAFLSHPGFIAQPDLMGVAGILLTMHACDNRTTWQEVHRLPPGHLLRWRAGEGVRLTEINSLKAHDTYFEYPPSRCQSLIQNTFNETVQRRTRLGETSILLSGGLDSRLVAGSLHWHALHKVPALTLGESGDYEMQCASRVAKSLGWHMHPSPVHLDAYPAWAPIQARLEGSQTSFVEFMWWQALDAAHKLKPRIMTGLLGDAVMGGSQIAYAFDPESEKYDFATQFKKANRFGHKPELVSRLLKQPGLAESVVEALYKTWSAYPGLAAQKCWLFDLHHRQRLHVGAAAWRLSFAAWPTLPYADSDLLHVMAGMAPPAFAERRAQNGMLCTKFPKLAALPLDRGGPDIHPMMPSHAWQTKHLLSTLPGSLRTLGRTIERRQYVRHFDINSGGWHSVRSLAEPYRSTLRELFDSPLLDELLPAPDRVLSTPDAVIDGARYKTLLGLLLQFGPVQQGDPQ